MPITTLSLQQILDLQWLNQEGYEVLADQHGFLTYVDGDLQIKDAQNKGILVTDLFLNNTKPMEEFCVDLERFAEEHHCGQCQSYCDPQDIIQIDADFDPDLPSQVCTSCCQDVTDDRSDPYTLRGLHRSDFY